MGLPARKLWTPPAPRLQLYRAEDLRGLDRRGRDARSPRARPRLAIAFRAASGPATDTTPTNGSGGASVGPSWSAATLANSDLFAALVYDVTSTVSVPAAWSGSEITGSPFTNGAANLRVYHLPGAASQSGAQTFSFNTAPNAGVGMLLEYTGAKSSASLDGTPNSNTGNSVSPAGSAYTTTVANNGVISFVGQASATATATITFSAATGGSAIRGQATDASAVTPKGNAGLAVLDELVVAVGTYTFGCTSNRSQVWVVVTLAIQPPAANAPSQFGYIIARGRGPQIF